MEETALDLNARIAERVRELRAAAGLSLDALAGRSGVSRSMISVVERGESSPTAVVLEKLATGLGVTMAAMFESPRAWRVSSVSTVYDGPARSSSSRSTAKRSLPAIASSIIATRSAAGEITASGLCGG